MTALTGADRGGVRIAIVGGGAVATMMHIPAVRRAGLAVTAVFDVDADRARMVAEEAGGAVACTGLDEVARYADAAIVAVPHQFHAEVACTLMDRGLDVLVEKPMAPTVAECETMLAAAERTGRVLEVGLMRRHAPALQWLARLAHDEVLGQIEHVDLREGFVFAWPVTSSSFFSTHNGGVLMDSGAHALDLLAWLLPSARVEKYVDDAAGGVEADCRIALVDERGTRATVELSRTRQLRNSVVILCGGGTVEVDVFGTYVTGSQALIHRSRRRTRISNLLTRKVPDLFDAQLAAWVAAVRREGPPLVGGHQAMQSIRLMEECAAVRQQLEYPWLAT